MTAPCASCSITGTCTRKHKRPQSCLHRPMLIQRKPVHTAFQVMARQEHTIRLGVIDGGD